MAAALLTALFSALVFIGGIVGFVKTASATSLFFGTAFGLLLAFSAYLINVKKTERRGFILSLVLLGALGAVMLYRFLASFKFMPAGLVALLSISLLIHNFYRASRKKYI